MDSVQIHKELGAQLQGLVGELGDLVKSFTNGPPNDMPAKFVMISIVKQIAAVLTEPEHHPLIATTNMIGLVTTRTLMHIGAFKNLPQDGSISLPGLAQATKTQESLLERMMRFEVCTGLVNLTDGDKYSHSKFSRPYAQSSGSGLFFQMMYDEYLAGAVGFPTYLDERGRTEPRDQAHNPYTWTAGVEGKSVWEVMERNPERLKAFQQGLSTFEDNAPSAGSFDYGLLDAQDSRPILVDVGGGSGISIVEILKRFPRLPPNKFILQDRDEVISLTETSGMLPKGVVTMVHDFFTEQPVKGAKAYYIRRCLHDYNDDICAQILQPLVNASAPDSRILISEAIMAEKPTEADLGGASLDCCVMIVGGKERTPAQFQLLFKKVGLELVKIWREPGSVGGIVEARVAR